MAETRLKTREFAAPVWRAVESQHRVSTMRLVDNDQNAQLVLEQILEASKPPVPPEAARHHWLISTPFRYPPPPGGSRFRGEFDPGVFYGAIEQRTACAEVGYWRWRFVKDTSAFTSMRAKPMSVFCVEVKARRAVDLRKPPLSRRRKEWMSADDYSATQALAQRARDESVAAIVYESVRDPQHGAAVAVLDVNALHADDPPRETWYLTIAEGRAIWRHDWRDESFVFEFTAASIT